MKDSTAKLSKDGKFRYSLGRRVRPINKEEGETGDTTCLFIMCNPSTADSLDDDPTIVRCLGFAESWGFTRMEVVNLFSIRTPNVKDVQKALKAGEPICGPTHWQNFDKAVASANIVVCAWGAKTWAKEAIEEVEGRLAKVVDTVAIRITKSGYPEHPLYLPEKLTTISYKSIVEETHPEAEDAEYSEVEEKPPAEIVGISKDVMLVKYRPFAKQLIELGKENEKLVFDVTTTKGMKEAKAHIYKFRKVRVALDDARKEEKAASLEYGRLVDNQADDIKQQINDMIKVHQKPIDIIEDAEKARVKAHKDTISLITEYEAVAQADGLSGKEIEDYINELSELNPLSDKVNLEELADEGVIEFERVWGIMQQRLQAVKNVEENEALKQQVHDDEIRRQTLADAGQVNLRSQTQVEVEQVTPIAQPIMHSPALAPIQEQPAEITMDRKKQVNNEILTALVSAGIEEEVAKTVIRLMVKGALPNVIVNYG